MKNRSAERKRLRLSGYDYSTDGYYFVTICTQNSECFFGGIKNGITGLNEIGEIVTGCMQDIPNHFCDVKLSEWIVMPNHVHGVVVIERQFNNDTFIIDMRNHVGDADLRNHVGDTQICVPYNYTYNTITPMIVQKCYYQK